MKFYDHKQVNLYERLPVKKQMMAYDI